MISRRGALAAAGLAAVAAMTWWGWTSFAEHEVTLYSADHVAYWAMTGSLAEAIADDGAAAMLAVARSVDERELNLLPSAPLAPVLLLFGSSRATYLGAVAVVYALPALVIGWWCLRRWLGPGHDDARAIGAWTWCAALFTPLWWPVALGYLDIGGLILAWGAFGLILESPSAQGPRHEVRIGLVAGALLGLLVLFRRWYGILAAATALVLVVEALWLGWRAARGGGRDTAPWRHLATLVGAGLTAVAMAPHRVWTALTTDYGDRFGHYKVLDSVAAEIASYGQHFGWVAMLIAVLAAVAVIGDARARRGGAMLAAQLIVVHVLFRRIQDPSPQHWYLVLPALMLLTSRGALLAWDRIPTRRRPIGLGAAAGLAVVLAARTFGLIPIPGPPLAPEETIRPQRRSDVEEIRALLDLLDRRVESGAGGIAVLAGQGPVTDTALAFANLSLGSTYQSPRRVLMGAHVDLRDGFPGQLLAADLVVLPLPLQTRIPPHTQRVVSVPVDQFQRGVGIARAFTPVGPRFHLEHGVTARVFERHRPNTRDEVTELSSALEEFYPDRPFVWRPSRLTPSDAGP